LTLPAAQRLALFGSTGRMGQAIVLALRGVPHWRLGAAVASAHSAHLGKDAVNDGQPLGVLVGSDVPRALEGATVAMDFGAASAVGAHAQACVAAGVPLLVGATGLDEATRQALRVAAERIAVLIAPNTSVGVGALRELVASAARRLGPDWDIQIVEAHHRDKRDAPSGTALALGEAIAQAASISPASIGFAVVRAGDIVGEHTVIFASAGERLELTHRATDRRAFALGALRAADWLTGKPAGLYAMHEVVNQT
jgi:4-hydroxy-tetrahydrodipicolinate reductase